MGNGVTPTRAPGGWVFDADELLESLAEQLAPEDAERLRAMVPTGLELAVGDHLLRTED